MDDPDLKRKPLRLMWINAPHYCAGLIFKNGIVHRAAPIVAWMKGKDFSNIIAYLNSKRYEYYWTEINGH